MKQINLQPEDTLYVLGDVIDRHPGGIRILRRIMAMPNARMLLGNHEYMMLRALGCPYDDYVGGQESVAHWYRNGGKVTHDHLKHIRKTLREEIVHYLRTLPLNIDVEVNGVRYKLVHGAAVGAYDGDPKYRNRIHFAVWKRLGADDQVPGGEILIFGHTPTMYYQENLPMEIWKSGRMIGIDCGSGYSESKEDPLSRYGRLACLRLDDGKVFYSEE
jgi:serine/threonine protein phosphatase 1